MGIRLVVGSLIALVAVAPVLGETPLTTAFTYQGQLKEGGAPFDGTADFQFTLWDAAGSGNPPTGGTQVGGVQAINALPVTAGLFSVALNAGGEFGGNAFNGNARWVQVAMRSPAGGGLFTTLAPRQPLTPTPYALQTRGIYVDPAGNVGIGSLAPSVRLEVADAQGVARISSYGVNGSVLSLYNTNEDPSSLGSIDFGHTSGTFGKIGYSWSGMDFGTPASTWLRITPSGKVGIGTIDPTHRLTVQSTDNRTLHLVGPTSVYGYGARLNFGDGDFAFLEEDQDDKLNFRANRFAFSGGIVGIGTTNPEGMLHVAGQSGDNSVILPTDAIGRNEILDEPGLASRLRTPANDEPLLLPNSVIPIMSRTMVAPGAGYILAMAYLGVHSTDDSLGSAGISPTAGVFGTEELSLGQSVHTNPPYGLLTPASVSLHAVYAIQGPGSYTYYLNAWSWVGGAIWVGDARLTLLYFPTAYGVVDVSSTAALNGLAAATQPLAQATDTPLATSTTGAGSTTATSEEINNSLRRMVERQQATIEELLQRVGVLEGKSDP
jgi:hypothetical protein